MEGYKEVKAVKPYIYPNQLNFKDKPFNAWKEMGLPCVAGWYPRLLHKLMFNVDMPSFWSSRWFQMVFKCFNLKREARLVFVQPVTLYFDTFFVAPFHEMIPFVWDCWPQYDDMMVRWLKRHKVKVAIFTSSQARERIQKRLPELKTMYCPEGIDVDSYPEGKPLKERAIVVYTYGRQPGWAKDLMHSLTAEGFNILEGGTNEEFHERLQNAKITIAVPRCDVSAEQTGGQETLTQRYWECMLSRTLMVGRAPKELVDLIGYNPVLQVDNDRLCKWATNILCNIVYYQNIVDRNREIALMQGNWMLRINNIRFDLFELGYFV